MAALWGAPVTEEPAKTGPVVSLYRQKSAEETTEARNALIEVLALAADPTAACQHAACETLEGLQTEAAAWLLLALLEIVSMRTTAAATESSAQHPLLNDALVHKAAVMAAATWEAGKPATLTVSMDEMSVWLRLIIDREVKAVVDAHDAAHPIAEVPEALSDALELVAVGLNGFGLHDVLAPNGAIDTVRRVIHHASLEEVPLAARAALLEALAMPLQNTASMQFSAGQNSMKVSAMPTSLRSIVDRCVLEAQAVEKNDEGMPDAAKIRRLADLGRVIDKAALAMYHMSRTAFIDGEGIAQRYMLSLASATYISHEAAEAVGAVSEGGIVPPPKILRAVVAALVASSQKLLSVTTKPAVEAEDPDAYQLQRAQLNAAWALGKVITMTPDLVMKTKGLSTTIIDMCLHTFSVFGTNIESAASASQVAAIESRMHTLNVLDQVMRALPPAMGRRKLKQAIVDASKRGDAEADYRWHAAGMIALMYGAEGCRDELANDADIESVVLKNLKDRNSHPLTRFYALRCLSEVPFTFIARNILTILAVGGDELKSLKDGRKSAADFTTWNTVELTSHLVSSIVAKYEEHLEHNAEDAKDSEDDDMNFGESRMSAADAAVLVAAMARLKHAESGFEAIVKGTIELVSSSNPFVSVSAAQAVRNLVAVPIGDDTACGFVDGMLVYVESWIKRDQRQEAPERAASSASSRAAETSIFDLCGRPVVVDAKLRSDYRWMARGGQTPGAVLTGAHNAFVNLLGDGSKEPSYTLRSLLDRFVDCVRALLESRRGRDIGSPIAAATILATRGLLRMPQGFKPPMSMMPKIIETALNGVGCPQPHPVPEDTYPLHMRGAEDLEREVVVINGRQVAMVEDPEHKNFETYIETCANMVMDIIKFSIREGLATPLQHYVHDFATVPSMLLVRSPAFTARAAGHMPSVINELALMLPGTMCNFVQALMVLTMMTPPDDDDVAEEEAAFCAQSLGTIVESVPDLLRFYHALGQARGVQKLLMCMRQRMTQALDRSITVTRALQRIEERLARAESDDDEADEAPRGGSGSDSDPENTAAEDTLEQLRAKLHDTDICASRLPALYGVCLRLADFLVENTRVMEIVSLEGLNSYPGHTLDPKQPSDTAVTASLNTLWWCNKHLPRGFGRIEEYLNEYNKLLDRFCDQMVRLDDADMGQSLFSSLNELLQRMALIYSVQEFRTLIIESKTFAGFLKKAAVYLMSPLAKRANSNSATANATSLLLTAVIVCPECVFDDITPAAVLMAFTALEQNMPIKGDAGEAIWVYARLTHWFTRADFGVMAHVPRELQLKMARKMLRSKHARAPLKKVLEETILNDKVTKTFVTPSVETPMETLSYVLFGATPGSAPLPAVKPEDGEGAPKKTHRAE